MKHFTEDLNFLNTNFENLCTDCSGLGHIVDTECSTCDATGYKILGKIKKPEELYENMYSRHAYDRHNRDLETCIECDGMGHSHETECTSCNASGLVLKNSQKQIEQKAAPSRPQLYRIRDLNFSLCSTCEGEGHVNDQECFNCNATGLKPRATMKYDLNQYAELYRKHISFGENYTFNGSKEKIMPTKEKQH